MIARWQNLNKSITLKCCLICVWIERTLLWPMGNNLRVMCCADAAVHTEVDLCMYVLAIQKSEQK